MLSKEIYGLEYIRELQKRYGKDPNLLERVVFAFGLLEALVTVEMPFIFKGGTSLMLLTEHPMRLSTDIDIIVNPGTDVMSYIMKASQIFPFKTCEEQERIGKNRVEKKHYKFTYQSPVLQREFYILLDVVFMDNPYASVLQKNIQNELLLTERMPTIVNVPSLECILGDKLTAFAPHTTGILLGQNKELEIMKQLYDIYTLSEMISQQKELWETYEKVVAEEIAFRDIQENRDSVLQDTIRATACIIGRGSFDAEEYHLFVRGAQSLESHILQGKYNGEIAAVQACKVMYLAACVLTKTSFAQIENPEKYIDESISKSRYRKLSYIKKQKLEAYGYLVEAVRLLEE